MLFLVESSVSCSDSYQTLAILGGRDFYLLLHILLFHEEAVVRCATLLTIEAGCFLLKLASPRNLKTVTLHSRREHIFYAFHVHREGKTLCSAWSIGLVVLYGRFVL